jgi:anti-sigma B factor antagonist
MCPEQRESSDPSTIAILKVHIESSSGGVSTVALAGELDLSTIPRMEIPLLEPLEQRPGVLVDLSELEFIDSSGIGVLIRAFQGANGTPMSLLIEPESVVDRIFRIAGISEALPVFTDRKHALAELSSRRNGRNRDGR